MTRDLRLHLRLSVTAGQARALLAALLLAVLPIELGSETLTLTTAYPAPAGVYYRMITTNDAYLARDGGSVGIGTSSPQGPLDVRSTTGGFLPPRMTGAQRDLIAAPRDGSIIFKTDLPQRFEGYYNGGWRPLAGGDATPDFDSGWFAMQSQQGINSHRQVAHGLGLVPSKVKVLTRAVSGPNNGYIFEGIGSSQDDDDRDSMAGVCNYGGLVFAYNAVDVRLWAPDVNNNTCTNGSIINVFDGWGGEVNAQRAHDALVRVLAWR